VTELLTVTERRLGDIVVLCLEGEADLASIPRVGDRVSQLLASGARRVRVDLTDLGFIDSTAVAVLLSARRTAEASGAVFELICPEGPAHRVLSLLGVLPVFGLAATPA